MVITLFYYPERVSVYSFSSGNKLVIKELQMVFLTSTVINSNGNMKELERKIKCEKSMFQ